MMGTSGRGRSPVNLLAEEIHQPGLGAQLSPFLFQLFQEEETNSMNFNIENEHD